MNFMDKVRPCNASSTIDTSRLLHNVTLLSEFTTLGRHQLQKQPRCHIQSKGSGPELKTLPLFFEVAEKTRKTSKNGYRFATGTSGKQDLRYR
jgi:hypothetical protein